MRVGALTIGQAPRDDVTHELLAAAGPGIELLQAGALDGLSSSEIASLAPSPTDGDPVRACGKSGTGILVTRLRDGSEVKVDEGLILNLMQRRLLFLEDAGVSFILLLCSGDFPPFVSQVPILKPDALLGHFVAALASEARGGRKMKVSVVVPSAEQEVSVKAKWRKYNIETVITALSPYSSTDSEIEAAILAVAGQDPDLVVLDCIGFGGELKTRFSRHCHVPIILPRSLLGRTLAELIPS
jgi:protein AroM